MWIAGYTSFTMIEIGNENFSLNFPVNAGIGLSRAIHLFFKETKNEIWLYPDLSIQQFEQKELISSIVGFLCCQSNKESYKANAVCIGFFRNLGFNGKAFSILNERRPN